MVPLILPVLDEEDQNNQFKPVINEFMQCRNVKIFFRIPD
jgi:hypothetical protein